MSSLFFLYFPYNSLFKYQLSKNKHNTTIVLNTKRHLHLLHEWLNKANELYGGWSLVRGKLNWRSGVISGRLRENNFFKSGYIIDINNFPYIVNIDGRMRNGRYVFWNFCGCEVVGFGVKTSGLKRNDWGCTYPCSTSHRQERGEDIDIKYKRPAKPFHKNTWD